MMKHKIIELELRRRLAAPGRFEWLKIVAEETLALLRDLLASDDDKECAELGRRLDALRSKLEGDEEARALAEQVLLSCREAVNRAMRQRQLMFTQNEAAVDPLTGIANRRTFDQLLADWTRKPGMQFVLAFIDVDDFKSINDTHGHVVGDQMLIAIAKRLSDSFRSDDVVSRIGGDEFAVMVSHLTLRQAESRFGKLISGLFPVPGDGALPCLPKVTCGLAEFSAGDTAASLCVRADQAMDAAKRLGKNRVVAKEQAFVCDLLRRQV